jgi:mannose-1-phosphate guanylyltransferase
MTDSKAILIVGGPSRGTRFRPLSLDVPKVPLNSTSILTKPLFPVAGHPIIFHHLSALRKVPSIKEVLLIGFYEESVFREFVKSASEQFPNWSIK